MQIQAKVLHRQEQKDGTSTKGNQWASIDFIVEYTDNQNRPHRAILQFFGVEQVNRAVQELQQGAEATFTFDIDAREITTRSGDKLWLQTLRCSSYTLTTLNLQPAAPAPQQPVTHTNDDFPF